MFSKEFLLATVKEAVVTFVGTAGSVFLAFGEDLSSAAAVAGAVAGVRAVIGIVVKNVGTPDTPHL